MFTILGCSYILYFQNCTHNTCGFVHHSLAQMVAVLPETVKHVQCYVGLLHAKRRVKLICCSPYIENCVIITKESILRSTRLVLRKYGVMYMYMRGVPLHGLLTFRECFALIEVSHSTVLRGLLIDKMRPNSAPA